MINILGFEANNLKLDKKASMDLDIYYIGYVDKKPEWRVNSANPLYLMINRIDGFFEEKNGEKCLNISDTARNNEVLKNYKEKCLMGLNITLKELMTMIVNMKKIT